MFSPPYLQKYKGISTRHTCPECGQKQSFTLYLDGNTNEPIHRTVGKCNRESKCGYHYTPKQYFMDNPSFLTPPLGGGWVGSHAMSNIPNTTKQIEPPQPAGSIHFSFIEKSTSYRSNFVRFLCEILTDKQIEYVGEHYALGATKSKEVIFWQIDIHGKVHTGKIMQYNPETGKRIKHENGAIDWIHSKLKKSGTLPEDYNLQQCFFGEHLLTIYPDATVCIVESEKSALISAAIFPNFIWLASGGIQGLAVDKCKVLKGRTVILYPDLNAFEKWSEKSLLIKNQCSCKITVSTLLEDIATPEAKAKGLDVADFMIEQLKSPHSSNSQKVEFLSPNTFFKFPSPFGEGVRRTEEVGESPQRGKEVRGVGGEAPPVQTLFSYTRSNDRNKSGSTNPNRQIRIN